MQDDKAEHPADTRAVCQLPDDDTTEEIRAAASPHTTLRGAGAARTLLGARSTR